MCEQEKVDTFESDPLIQTILAYEKIADAYAATWFDDPLMEPMLYRFLSFLEEPGGVLDAGCGPGRDVLAMTRRGIEAVGIDFCDAMVAQARARVPSCVFRRMDMRYLKYPPETFAGVWACGSLHHLKPEDAARALKEFARVLKPEGVLGVTVQEGQGDCFDHLGRYRHFYTAADFRKLIIESGFQIVEEYADCTEKETLGKNRPKKWLQVLARKSSISLRSIENGPEYDCVLCPTSRFQLHRQIGIPGTESIIWGNDDLYVIPDVAPFMEGHLLMVTTSHYVCFGACPDTLSPSIRATQQRIRQLLWEVYHESTLFLEHGPALPKEAGACINHAHWHCLPASLPVKEVIERHLGPGQVATIDTLRCLYQAGQSYLYIEEGTEEGWVYLVDIVPSQFLRQAIAFLLGQRDWRWQTLCKMPDIQQIYRRTLERLLPLNDKL